MLKLVVFDDGWGGELVANFLMEELEIAEIIRVIDWSEAPYSHKTEAEICELATKRLASYVGMADAIILAGYTISLALTELCRKFPGQVFIGMGVNYDKILRSRNSLENIVVLAERLVIESSLQNDLRLNLPYSTLILPDCDGWQEKIDQGSMTRDLLAMDLATDFQLDDSIRSRYRKNKKCNHKSETTLESLIKKRASLNQQELALKAAISKLNLASEQVKSNEEAAWAERLNNYSNMEGKDELHDKIKPNTVLLLNTHFWDIKEDLEAILGWNVRVIDFREKLLRDICRSLHLRGVDGKRSK